MPELFRAWRNHCLACQLCAIPLLLTSVLFRCDSLSFGAFPTLFGAYPSLCVANQYHSYAPLITAQAVLCYAAAFLCLSPPPRFTASPCLCLTSLFSAYATLVNAVLFRRYSVLCHYYARPFGASLLLCRSLPGSSIAFQSCAGQLHSKSVRCFSPPFHRRATHGLAITRRFFSARRISIACIRFFRRKFQRFSCRN